MFPDDVTLAIISHNALQRDLPRCLRAATETGCPSEQLMVIDVASTDGTDVWMRKHHPQIRCISLADNRGPNVARNRALREAATPFVLLIDVDVELLPGTVQHLRNAHRDDIAITTPAITYPDRPDTIHYAKTFIHYLGEASASHMDRPVSSLGDEPYDVGNSSGCAPMIRRDAAEEVGLFDENLFFGKTDGEFSYRLNAAGYRIVETPTARVLHHHQKRGGKYFDHQIANRWYFMFKLYQWRTLALCAPALILHEFAIALFLIAKGKPGSLWRGARRFAAMYPVLRRARRHAQRTRQVGDAYLLRGSHLVVPIRPHKRPGMLALLLYLYVGTMQVYWLMVGTFLRLTTTPPTPRRSADAVTELAPSAAP